MEHCTNHPDRETGRRCTRCGRPACSECLVTASVGAHCTSCTRAAAPSRREQRTLKAALGQAPLWATKALIGINVVVAVLAIVLEPSRSASFSSEYGLWGPAVSIGGEWWRLITGGFLHGSLLHLGMNMLLLWILGRSIEATLGPTRFALLYTAGLTGGSFGALLLAPTTVTVGASGAVFGLLGAMTVQMYARGINPLDTQVGGLLVINLVLSFLVPNISIGGHLGGLVAGAIAGRALLEPKSQSSKNPAAVAIAVLVVVVTIAGGLWAADQALR